jgi:hypothetical protein
MHRAGSFGAGSVFFLQERCCVLAVYAIVLGHT